MKYGFLNDSMLPADHISIPIMDLSIQRGFGVFDFMRLHNGQNWQMDQYMERFFNSLKGAGLAIKPSKSDIIDCIDELIKKNDSPNSCIKLIATGGVSPNGYIKPEKGNFILLNMPFVPPTEDMLTHGVSLITHMYQRPMPEVKSTNYFCSLALSDKMKKYKAVDVIYYHPDKVFETSRCNIYVVKNNVVYTPKDGMLSGMTRHRILHMDEHPVPLKEEDISKDFFDSASEVFISSTTKGILPVTHIDGQKIGTGRIGKVTKEFSRALREYDTLKNGH